MTIIWLNNKKYSKRKMSLHQCNDINSHHKSPLDNYVSKLLLLNSHPFCFCPSIYWISNCHIIHWIFFPKVHEGTHVCPSVKYLVYTYQSFIFHAVFLFSFFLNYIHSFYYIALQFSVYYQSGYSTRHKEFVYNQLTSSNLLSFNKFDTGSPLYFFHV